MRHTTYENGFTLVELLVALMVSSIILASVATLAYAMGSANDSSNELSINQAQIRYTTVRLGELIKHSKLICVPNNSDDLAIWQGDYDNDNQIDPNELVYIEAGSSRNYIKLLEFPSATASEVLLDNILNGSEKNTLITCYNERQTTLIPLCGDVQFYPSGVTPQDEFVSILFDISEDGIDCQYQISAHLLGWAGNLLNESGTSIVSDDD